MRHHLVYRGERIWCYTLCCLERSFPYVSREDHRRFAAVFVTVTGGCLNIVINIPRVDVEERDTAFVRGRTVAAEFPFIVLYYSARLSLLVLALRALPYDAFESPPWTSFIPHVS